MQSSLQKGDRLEAIEKLKTLVVEEHLLGAPDEREATKLLERGKRRPSNGRAV